MANDIRDLYRGRDGDLAVKVVNPHNERRVALALTPEGMALCKEAEDYLFPNKAL